MWNVCIKLSSIQTTLGPLILDSNKDIVKGYKFKIILIYDRKLMTFFKQKNVYWHLNKSAKNNNFAFMIYEKKLTLTINVQLIKTT